MRAPTLISFITFVSISTSSVTAKHGHANSLRAEKHHRRTPTPVVDGLLGLHHDDKHHWPSPRPEHKCCKEGFVPIKDGNLQTCDGRSYRFAGLNAPDLLEQEEFEVVDTFLSFNGLGRAVTRTYTLEITGTTPWNDQSRSHITGWNDKLKDWEWNEEAMKRLDRVVAAASRLNTKLIFPVANQDFGDVSTNWKGNYVDLIIHRYGKGWNYTQAQQNIDFFTDRSMIDGYKLILTSVLNRINTVTGVRYGDDSTFLAWETGNEMQWQRKGKQPAPAAWTIEIGEHIKSLAPCALVMDGSYSKSDTSESAFRPEVLESKEVDIMSYHYYGTGDSNRVVKDTAIAAKHGKVFVGGEYGFFAEADHYATFLALAEKQPEFGGSLVWGFRPHSKLGGFVSHSEGDDINYSYHVPGWPNSQIGQDDFDLPKDWDKREAKIVDAIRDASFAINGEAVPRYPTPNAPAVWLIANKTNTITWKGSAWASTYEIYGSGQANILGKGWKLLEEGVLDVFNAGKSVSRSSQVRSQVYQDARCHT